MILINALYIQKNYGIKKLFIHVPTTCIWIKIGHPWKGLRLSTKIYKTKLLSILNFIFISYEMLHLRCKHLSKCTSIPVFHIHLSIVIIYETLTSFTPVVIFSFTCDALNLPENTSDRLLSIFCGLFLQWQKKRAQSDILSAVVKVFLRTAK